MNTFRKQLSILFLFTLVFFAATEVHAQDFKDLDKSPHDIVYYRANKISPPIIKVLYGRPQKHNREIFGKLIPYGKVWRVGANEATEIRFYQDVLFGNKPVKKGTYTLYAIPEEKEWTLILSSNLDTWGTYEYDKKFDAARTTAKVSKAEPIEAFSIAFKDKSKHIEIILGWDTTRVKLPIILQ